ncbi:MAG: glycosyl hydrolase 115 family protein [Opitutaceae bacterium]
MLVIPVRATPADAPPATVSESWVSDLAVAGAFPLAVKSGVAPVWAAPTDWPGVLRAARDLQADVERVTGQRPLLATTTPSAGPAAVLIGTVGRSPLIDGLVASGKLDVTEIRGRWESFLIQTVEQPLPGVARALVIAGSDKRGTIYGIYEVSRQIGVSPWYDWADVPVKRRAELFVHPGRRVDPGPVVRYRGIFLNDEAPALTGWVHEKYGRFGHEFYGRLFELMLRLRANYLWPAMWLPRAFNDDDPENPRLADEYGIVMGTSHHEPLLRAHAEWGKYGKGPWDYSKNAAVLREFWRGGVERSKGFETVQSLGMRGDGDEAMSAETNTRLLETIVADQRELLSTVTGRPAAQIPQLWALYKEVQGYYEAGMRVPDDVILLWCDDNWGNLRRLPTPEERKRPGGAGVYYHFDYVGGPRNYKWINVTPITKIWEQMHLAWRHEATRLWIVNVGDLKPMEFPTEFFLTYAWNPERWPYEKLEEYSRHWAARQFGPAQAGEIAALINGYSKLNRRRTPELLAPDTYSLSNYREAERVLGEWTDLVRRAETVNAALAPEFRDAFFQLVLYPVKASAGVVELYVSVGLNRLYARQGRSDAGVHAARARELFAADRALSDQYHQLGGGKWKHLMSQIKFGYTTWQSPEMDVMPAVHEVMPRAGASLGAAIEGSEVGWPVYAAPRPVLPEVTSLQGATTRWLELFNRGQEPFEFRVSADQPWVKLPATRGRVADRTVRLELGIDWTTIAPGRNTATVTVDAGAAGRFSVQMPAHRVPEGAVGFVEADQHIAIDSLHFDRTVQSGEVTWKSLPEFGRTRGGITAFPVTHAEVKPGGDSPRLEYDLHTFSSGDVKVEVHLAPSLDFQSGEGLRYGISIDDEAPQVVKVGTWSPQTNWETAVADSVRRVTTSHRLALPGRHTLKFWLVTPGVVLERIVIDTAPVPVPAPGQRGARATPGVRPSYLGPPESPRVLLPPSPWAVSPEERQRIQKLNQEDHADMLRQLGITRLRPGRNSGAGSTVPPNYDEAKANPFPDWPELLTLKDGTPVTTAEQWIQRRRPEIAEEFAREIVGRVPAAVPAVTWTVTRQLDTSVGGMPVVARQVTGRVDNSAFPNLSVAIHMAVVMPVDARKPAPVLVMFGSGAMPDEPAPRFPGAQEPPAPPSPEQLIAAGWGYVSLNPGSIQADNGAGLTAGIIGLTNRGQRRTPEQWGALRAWAWGAGRALDYLETLPAVDAKRVGIEGVSRYGKAALVAMAFEPRFAIALIGSSGEGGVKPHRREFGETVENLTAAGAYHWMAGNFLKYGAAEATFGARTPGDLPVDSHQLLALCAPRPVFVSYGIPEKGDSLWLDAPGSYRATVAAGPAYRLLGAKDLGVKDDYRTAALPPVNTGLLEGELAWRQHDGGHEDRSNLSFFISWANRLFGYAPPARAADQPVMRADRNSHLAHAQLLQKARAGGISVYFLGDSITRRWGATDYPDFLAHWKQQFHGWNAGNFGWGADTTQNMLWRLHHGELDGVNPRVIVLLAGTNNIGGSPGDDAKVDDVTRGITAIVNLCRAKAPDATLILMGVLPRNDGPVVPTINRINANLERLADGNRIRYLNINDRLADRDGRLFDGMTVDRLHLSLKGYQVWADALKPLLTDLLGPPSAVDTAPPPTGDPSARPLHP